MLKPCDIVTFTTDFGVRDTFVGEMKGAALAIRPALTLVDLTHHVPPRDLETGSFLLASACARFPVGTVHVAVVDPGVGTARRALAVETGSYFFVAPDNGLLSRILDRDPAVAVHAIENPAYRARHVSATFEGRDVFAPAAAWIASGTPLPDLGPQVDDPVRLAWASPLPEVGGSTEIRVLVVDRFGNATLDLPGSLLEPLLDESEPAMRLRIETPRGTVDRIGRTYADVGRGIPFLLVNSSDRVEIALRDDDAARRLGIEAGGTVRVTLVKTGKPRP